MSDEEIEKQDQKSVVQDRLHSAYVWTAIIAQVVLIIALFNPGIAETVKAILTSVCSIFTAIGILNNPTDKVNW